MSPRVMAAAELTLTYSGDSRALSGDPTALATLVLISFYSYSQTSKKMPCAFRLFDHFDFSDNVHRSGFFDQPGCGAMLPGHPEAIL